MSNPNLPVLRWRAYNAQGHEYLEEQRRWSQLTREERLSVKVFKLVNTIVNHDLAVITLQPEQKLFYRGRGILASDGKLIRSLHMAGWRRLNKTNKKTEVFYFRVCDRGTVTEHDRFEGDTYTPDYWLPGEEL